MSNISDVSIIIVNLNTQQLLEACLVSLYEYTRDVIFEVIVVDNHSSDDSVAMVKTKFPQVRLIENMVNNRYAIANNQGLEIAQGKYVLYLNSDILLSGNSIQEMAHFLETQKDAGGVGGRLVYPDGTHQDSCFRFPAALNLFYLLCLARFYWKIRFAGNYVLKELRTTRPVDFVVGACFMARREILLQCRGMDPDYYLYGEDADLCYRIQQAGWQIYYLPTQSPIIHYGGASTMHLLGAEQKERQIWGWKARFLFVKKQYSFWKRLLILGAMILGFGVNILLYGLAFLKRWDKQYTWEQFGFTWEIIRKTFGML